MSEGRSWTNDWEAFVRLVGELYGRGLNDNGVTEQFAGKRVVWEGRLAEKRFAKRLGLDQPGIQMEMPPVSLDLTNGRHVKVDYLFLNLKAGEHPMWQDIEVGETVRFETGIRQASGPFAGIQWLDLDENRGLITFLTDGGIPMLHDMQ